MKITKAIGTAVSGYFAKQMVASLQAVVLDSIGSDCKSKGTLKVFLTKSLANDFLYRYIVEGSKLILLDDNNISKYIDKFIQVRSPMYCISSKLCRACAGQKYNKLKIDNIGLTAAKVSTTLTNLSMKKFHNSSQSIVSLKVDELCI